MICRGFTKIELYSTTRYTVKVVIISMFEYNITKSDDVSLETWGEFVEMITSFWRNPYTIVTDSKSDSVHEYVKLSAPNSVRLLSFMKEHDIVIEKFKLIDNYYVCRFRGFIERSNGSDLSEVIVRGGYSYDPYDLALAYEKLLDLLDVIMKYDDGVVSGFCLNQSATAKVGSDD